MDFVNNYIAECIAKGKSSINDICLEAENEISNINNQIIELEKLKERQNNLKNVISRFKKKEKKQISSLNIPVSKEDLEKDILEIAKKICELIDSNQLMSTREVLDAFNFDKKTILIAIKWLWDREIIDKNEDSVKRELIKGNKWAERP